ncbi:MAG: DUF523 domain-containing protein [candidate division WOR-3 bacterium]|nr:DUF523 domain-containing protein [candidate division WOR-3 bacterium]
MEGPSPCVSIDFIVIMDYNHAMRIIMVSACLLGIETRYDGRSKPLFEAGRDDIVIPFCPEQFGSMNTPRPKATLSCSACDIIKSIGGVINENGSDVTGLFIVGARRSAALAKSINPDLIYLKEYSPSCGLNFTNINWERKRGMGIAAYLLNESGFNLDSM